MKTIHCIGFITILLAGLLRATDLTNTSGKIYHQVKITSVVQGGINIVHRGGAAFLSTSDLSGVDKDMIRNHLAMVEQEKKDAIVPSIKEIHIEYEDFCRIVERYEANKKEEKQKQIDHEEYEAATMRYFEELRKSEWERIERNAVIVLARYQHPEIQQKKRKQKRDSWSDGIQEYVKNGRSVSSVSTFGVPNSFHQMPTISEMYCDFGEGLRLLTVRP